MNFNLHRNTLKLENSEFRFASQFHSPIFSLNIIFRFATTKFTLERLDTQTHLTNNAIQKNLEMDEDIVDDVPDDKMWFSEDLDQYLKDCGYGAVWDKKIVPGMRRILTESCLSGQDAAEPRKNSFEIYGADFMLDELLNPWLIEINQGPTMSTSTTVTNELVQEMTDVSSNPHHDIFFQFIIYFKDLFKIILDRRHTYRSNKPSTPDTGNFELIFRQGPVECPRYIGNSLNIEGKGLIKPRPRQRTFIKQGTVYFTKKLSKVRGTLLIIQFLNPNFTTRNLRRNFVSRIFVMPF